jgi:hypothetical protein
MGRLKMRGAPKSHGGQLGREAAKVARRWATGIWDLREGIPMLRKCDIIWVPDGGENGLKIEVAEVMAGEEPLAADAHDGVVGKHSVRKLLEGAPDKVKRRFVRHD